jgi:glycosyltransferase involved in cell wall biosynthesis
MRVLHVAESFGAGVFDAILELVQGTPEYDHAIIHGLRNETPDSFEDLFPAGTEFHFWKYAGREVGPMREFLALVELVKLMRSIKPCDVVHLHSSKAGFHGRLACRLLGFQDKALYTPHGAPFLRTDISRLKARYYAFLENIASRFGGRIICDGATEAASFRELGMAARHIRNGIACDNILHSSPPGEIAVVGTSGRITHQKNPSLFNEIAKAFASDPSIRFLWFGYGELRHVLSSPNIQIAGWMPKDELIQRLRHIDFYLSTSLWEGLPLSVLLAMCAGKPLVLSDCIGNRELVENGRNGFTFIGKEEAIACIETLRADRNLAQEMGKFSHKLLLNNFHLDSMICQYKKLYASVAKANSRLLSQ